jgi:phospho-N-acetylmuramoyl-pentapeptide-transferase
MAAGRWALADSPRLLPTVGGETTPSFLEGIDHPYGREGLDFMRAILLSGGLAAICSLLGTRFAFGWFTRHGFGQPIRDDGPTTHHVKRGTPTMGGLVILLSASAAYLAVTILTGGWPSASAWLLLLQFLGCGVVGFLDDFIKVYTQHNQGLSSRAKMAGQTLVALVFGVLATRFFADERGVRPASTYISTTHDWAIKLPLVVVLLVIWFIVTATSNGANLTDGADGLLAGTSALVFGAYTVVNVWQNNQLCGSSRPTVVESQCYQVRDPLDLAVFSAAIAAACIGFLWWNAKPARIIMGDVGSLAIGGALAGLAIMSRTELLMAVIAGLFVLETMSVLLQMSYFKLTRRLTGTGRRIFRIAPIHHHFEHAGWDEVTVVIRFWIIAGIFVAAGLGIFYASWLA